MLRKSEYLPIILKFHIYIINMIDDSGKNHLSMRREKLCITSNENKGGFVKMLDDENTTTIDDDEDFTLEELEWVLDSSL